MNGSIVLISGSTRPHAQSLKVTRYLASRLAGMAAPRELEVIDLARRVLPPWDERLWQTDPESWNQEWGEVSRMLDNADGVVFITPEWGGMVPAALKNLFVLCGTSQLAHKPGLIVAISASNGGSYPVAELRMSSYKNTHICYLPTHLIITHVESVLNEPHPEPTGADAALRERIDATLAVFMAYVEGLVGVRAAAAPFLRKYPFGM